MGPALRPAWIVCTTALWVCACGAQSGGGDAGTQGGEDSGNSAATDSGTPRDAGANADAGPSGDAGQSPLCTFSDGGLAGACYAIQCATGAHPLEVNRDRLLTDLAHRKCTDRCTLWAALSLAERYIFLMDTAYFGDDTSRLYPPGAGNDETALDHAAALYSINAPDGSDLGGLDYNRIYLGFDPFAECVMRDFSIANPTHEAGYNAWQKSDDVAGPHAPFTQREMIYWYKAWYDLQSEGPQFHHWHQDSDFTQSGINVRLGVCGVTDRSLTESTIAFDFYHNSDPLGDYATRGGYGWQIVNQHVTVDAGWDYTPGGCPVTSPVNTNTYGGGTFAGMGPVLSGGVCTAPVLGDAGCD
jgi:hypothetical protein